MDIDAPEPPSRRGAIDLTAGSASSPPSFAALPSTGPVTFTSPFAEGFPSPFTQTPTYTAEQPEFDIAAGSPRWPTIPLPPCEENAEEADPGAPPPWPLPPLPLTLSLSALAIDDDDALTTASLDSASEAEVWEAASLLLVPRARRRAMSAPLRPGIVWDTRERGRAVGAGGEE
jgi:hypothetical protein